MDRELVLMLLSPLSTKKFEARNRFLRSATCLAAADDNSGVMSEAGISRIAELAAGGVGTVVSGFAYVSDEGKAVKKQWGLHHDGQVDNVRALSGAVHKHDAKLVVQIAHAGGQRFLETNTTRFSPSGLQHPGLNAPTNAMDESDIASVRQAFAEAALRAKEGGADAVQIHGGHGFLLTQFLSPLLNKREDQYGGSLENRSRFFFDLYHDVRNAVGESFPIWFKVSMREGVDDGYEASDGLFVCKSLLDLGADGIEISSGTPYANAQNIPSIIGVSAGESEAPFKDYALAIKKHASKDQIVTLTGGLRSLEVMSHLLTEGYCDLLGLSRPLIAEADLINRWYEEDARPAACISCNACSRTAEKGPIDCPVWRDKHEGNWDPL